MRRRRWFQGQAIYGTGVTDIAWFNPDGSEMTDAQWDVGYARSMTMFLNGQQIPSPGPQGERISDNSFLVFFNAHFEDLDFSLPRVMRDSPWKMMIDTRETRMIQDEKIVDPKKPVSVMARSLVVLCSLQ